MTLPGGRYCKPDCPLFHAFKVPYESWIHGMCTFDMAWFDTGRDRVTYPDGSGGTTCCMPEGVAKMAIDGIFHED